jgi:hypothetical protein
VGEEESGQLAASSSVRLTDRIGIGVLTRLVPRDVIFEIPTEPAAGGSGPLFCLLMSWYVVMTRSVFRHGYEELMWRLTAGLQFMRAWHKVGGSHP